MKKRTPIFFGLNIANTDSDTLIKKWTTEIRGILVFGNSWILWQCLQMKNIRRCLKEPYNVIVPITYRARLQVFFATGRFVCRIKEFQTLVRLLAQIEKGSGSVYIVDSKTRHIQNIENNLRTTFPNLRVIGRAVFSRHNESSIQVSIRKSEATVVLIGIVNRNVLSWLAKVSETFTKSLVVVAPRGIGKMSVQAVFPNIFRILLFPLRIFLPFVLLVHRLFVFVKTFKKQKGNIM